MFANLKQKILAQELKTGRRQTEARRMLNNFVLSGGGGYCYSDLPKEYDQQGRPCRDSSTLKKCANSDGNGCCPDGCEPGKPIN